MTLSVQLYTMIAMLLMGIWVGAAVDTHGRLMKPGRWTWMLFLSDVLFWIVQALLIFYVLLQVNEGDIRFYIFIALLCGFAAYRALFQTTYKRILEALIRFFSAFSRSTRNIVIHAIIKPIMSLLKLTLALIVLIVNAILAVVLFIMKVTFIPLGWIFGLIFSFLPVSVKNLCKRVAGFFKFVQNKIKNWFERSS